MLLPFGKLLLVLGLCPLVSQVNLVVILRFNACFVPHMVALILVVLLVEYGPFEVRQWFNLFDLPFTVRSLCELNMVSDFAFRVICDVV